MRKDVRFFFTSGNRAQKELHIFCKGVLFIFSNDNGTDDKKAKGRGLKACGER